VRINCRAWSVGDGHTWGRCSRGLYGGRPTAGVCQHECRQATLIDATKPLVEIAPTPAPAILAVPRDQWPESIAAIARFASVADKGIGDVVKRLWSNGTIYQRLQAAGVIVGQRGAPDTLKAVYALLMGKDCGCSYVQATMNAMYPLMPA